MSWIKKPLASPSSSRLSITTRRLPTSSVPPQRNLPSTKSKTESPTSSTSRLKTAFTSLQRSSMTAISSSATRKSPSSGTTENQQRNQSGERKNMNEPIQEKAP